MRDNSAAVDTERSATYTDQRRAQTNAAQQFGGNGNGGQSTAKVEAQVLRRERTASVEEVGDLKFVLAAIAVVGCLLILLRVDSGIERELFKGLAIVAGVVLMMDIKPKQSKNRKP